MGNIKLATQAAPSTPSSGFGIAYINSTSKLLSTIDDGGTIRTFMDQTLTGSEGLLMNGKISVTVSSNNLTLALKTRAGTDPSATNPVIVVIGGTLCVITAALSLTMAAATGWMNLGSAELATKEQDLFAYLSWVSGSSSIAILASRIPYAALYSDFSTTNINEKYAAYSTQPASTDTVVNIGRFAATLSAGAGYTWTVPAYTAANLVQRPIFWTRWLDWVPAFTNWTVGSGGTTQAKYRISNSVISIYVDSVLGSSGFSVGDVSHTLPFTCYAYGGTVGPVPGTLRLSDAGVAHYQGLPIFNATNACVWRVVLASGTYASQTPLTNLIPFTWGAADESHLWIEYPIALS